MEIKSLASTNFDVVVNAFEKAFSDYDVKFSADEVKSLCIRRGYVPELSFAAFDREEIAAFTLNGVGQYNDVHTAYDTGTGTLKEYRGQGLATRIFEYSVPFLRKAGIERYLLEVLQHNEKAVSVYHKIGFKITREFNFFVWPNDLISTGMNVVKSGYELREFHLNEYPQLFHFRDFKPSWQNTLESINRARELFINLGAFSGHQLIGYCILEPLSGDITQLAVDKNHRRKGVGTMLLQQAALMNQNTKMKMINVDAECKPVEHFLASKNIGISGKQFEMMMSL